MVRTTAPLIFVLFVCACESDILGDLGYDPAANPRLALGEALERAQARDRRALLIAGGAWCRWCHVLDDFLSENPDIKAELEKVFVVVKIYIGDENYNEEFFAALPEATGYPHFWVLAADGTVLQSVNTAGLERGSDDYDRDAFLALVRSHGVR